MKVKEMIHILLDQPQDQEVYTDTGHKVRSCDIGSSSWIKSSKLPKDVVVICTYLLNKPTNNGREKEAFKASHKK